MKIRNHNYACTRALGLIAATCAFAVVAWMAFAVSDAEWYVRALCLGIAGWFVVWAGSAVCRAAWWVELTRGAVRVKYVHRQRTLLWAEIREAKLDRIRVYVYTSLGGTIKIPFRSYPALILVPIRGPKIIVLLNSHQQSALDDLLRSVRG